LLTDYGNLFYVSTISIQEIIYLYKRGKIKTKWKKPDYFACEFIENYNQIILTLDKKIRNNEFEQWFVGYLPNFTFANGAAPWCLCQDVPYDEPSPWDHVEIEIINFNDGKAAGIWKWGSLKPHTLHSSWEEFSYKFRAIKENNKWKIAYMQGFDFEESIQ
jgi:hypothetical protein